MGFALGGADGALPRWPAASGPPLSPARRPALTVSNRTSCSSPARPGSPCEHPPAVLRGAPPARRVARTAAGSRTHPGEPCGGCPGAEARRHQGRDAGPLAGGGEEAAREPGRPLGPRLAARLGAHQPDGDSWDSMSRRRWPLEYRWPGADRRGTAAWRQVRTYAGTFYPAPGSVRATGAASARRRAG